MRPTSGLTFGGRYQLSNRIAIGGMGEVWQATDLVIGRTVAIKILKDEYLGDPGFLERFRAEARHAALVNHEGIANVFDYGEEEGSAYLVMELVPGEALSTILERERVLATDRVLDIVAQTASALHAAHAAGLVHRDIKPGNLLITPDGRVKITDFGIARIADQVPLTATGQVMGTVQYLSPEQASGHPASPTTDIYSLGIVAYEALAGRRPFTGESQVAIAMAQINETPPDLPVTVSEPVRNLVYSSIAKNPSDRPASAAHLARAAQALRRGDVSAAAAAVPGVLGESSLGTAFGQTSATRVLPTLEDATRPLPPAESKRRNPWTWPLVALIAILLVVLVGAIIALLGQPNRDKTPSTPPSTPPVSTSPSPSPSPDLVNISLSDFAGMTQSEVEAALDKLELSYNVTQGDEAPSKADELTVYDISPKGWVPKGTTMSVKIYAPIPPPSKPADLTANPAGPYTASQSVTITWPGYTCPTGSNLDKYTVAIENGTVTSSNPVPPGTTSATITLRADPGDTKVSYTASCSGTASPLSDVLTLTVP
ncbi:serine/threonine-protein kinase [Cryobacterium mesophilum]|uniref:non-specific serine/threonine protein kinase n=1 Tax=Terrimesophilobacter mesophilus TaxID=433647 RepID=A0A4R8VAH1_9MICO|nr:protein kinase [Terrimesophilobacter mesophilus]MBB5633155.1 serine/threonine-protein kinase [Terrimesophilobacter mesophilus]TFB79909.1 serine/threonine protein kinase [Terrimesophilobacter mesophilus]